MGEPFFKIKGLCKQHKIHAFSSNYTLYGDISPRIMMTIEAEWPHLEVYSIDEAFLDLSARIGEHAFALEIKDESMMPEFRLKDVLIIDPDTSPNPGDFVVARLGADEEVIIRKYKQLSASKISPAFELITLNEDWASIKIEANIHCELIGNVISLNRFIR